MTPGNGLCTWLRPTDLDDALRLVVAGGTPVGGGAALLSAALPCALGDRAVDLAGLLPAGVDGDVLGAGTTLAALATDPAIGAAWPALASAAAGAATPQVRAVATLGGSVAARLPGADLPAALAAYGARVLLRTAGGAAELPLGSYLAAPVHPPHLVLGVRLPGRGAGVTRRFAVRTGPAPALAVVAGVRTGAGLHLVAGAVGRDAAPLPFDDPGRPPGADRMRDDVRASAGYRARLVAALADEVAAELAA
ncbi:FAD binding domain-containing protein [Blastococcus sp. SYSU D00820]